MFGNGLQDCFKLLGLVLFVKFFEQFAARKYFAFGYRPGQNGFESAFEHRQWHAQAALVQLQVCFLFVREPPIQVLMEEPRGLRFG